MLLESAIIYTCLKGANCSTPSQAYYLAHPEYKVMLEKMEIKAKDILGKPLYEIGLPMIGFAVVKAGTFNLGKGFSLKIDGNYGKTPIKLLWSHAL